MTKDYLNLESGYQSQFQARSSAAPIARDMFRCEVLIRSSNAKLKIATRM
jgi:hypothetical protein